MDRDKYDLVTAGSEKGKEGFGCLFGWLALALHVMDAMNGLPFFTFFFI